MKHFKAVIALGLLVVAVGWFGDASAADQAPLDADNLDVAAGMVFEQSRGYTMLMDRCREKHPEGTFAFQMANYLWHEQNGDVLLASRSVLGTKISALEAKPRVTNDLEVNAFTSSIDRCMAFANNLVAGKMDPKVYTPKAYAFLHAVYARDDHMIDQWKRTHFEGGCMKNRANKGGRNFDQALASCQCITAAFYSTLSPLERADFEAHARDPDYTQHSPIVQKLRNAARTCPAILH